MLVDVLFVDFFLPRMLLWTWSTFFPRRLFSLVTRLLFAAVAGLFFAAVFAFASLSFNDLSFDDLASDDLASDDFASGDFFPLFSNSHSAPFMTGGFVLSIAFPFVSIFVACDFGQRAIRERGVVEGINVEAGLHSRVFFLDQQPLGAF